MPTRTTTAIEIGIVDPLWQQHHESPLSPDTIYLSDELLGGVAGDGWVRVTINDVRPEISALLDVQSSSSIVHVHRHPATLLLKSAPLSSIPRSRDMQRFEDALMSMRVWRQYGVDVSAVEERVWAELQFDVEQPPVLEQVVVELEGDASEQDVRVALSKMAVVVQDGQVEVMPNGVVVRAVLCHPVACGRFGDASELAVLHHEPEDTTITTQPSALKAVFPKPPTIRLDPPNLIPLLLTSSSSFQHLHPPHESCCFLTLKTAIHFDLRHGDRIRIKVKQRERTLDVCVVDAKEDVRGAIISPCTWLSLGCDVGGGNYARITRLGDQPPQVQVAKSMTLARMAVPWLLAMEHEKEVRKLKVSVPDLAARAVERYLKSVGERRFMLGDVLAVPCDPLEIFMDELPDEEGADLSGEEKRESVVLLYRVEELNGESRREFMVDVDVTKIEQAGDVVHGPLPPLVHPTDEQGIWTASRYYAPTYLQLSTLARHDSSHLSSMPTSIFLSAPPSAPTHQLVQAQASHHGLNYWPINLMELSGYASNDLATALKESILVSTHLLPVLVHFQHLQAVSIKPMNVEDEQQQAAMVARDERVLEKIVGEAMREVCAEAKRRGLKVVVVGTSSGEEAPKLFQPLFRHRVTCGHLPDSTKALLLSDLLESLAARDVDYEDLAKHHALPLDYAALRQFSHRLALTRDTHLLDHSTLISKLSVFVKQLPKSSPFLLASQPNTSFSDVGGLHSAKREIYSSLILPLRQNSTTRRSGLLFYGPPGCGKTLLAKAIATELQATFFSIKGPELMNMYVGETERNVRLVFQQARQSRRAVVFFDELDAVAPRRQAEGVMSRVVSQLLAEMDDLGRGEEMVFVIGATNRPDLLDPSLLRPGRFERLIYLECPQTLPDQLELLRAQTRSFSQYLDHSVDFIQIAALCTKGEWTGADYAALCQGALLNAVARAVDALDQTVREVEHALKSGVTHDDLKQLSTAERQAVPQPLTPAYLVSHLSLHVEKYDPRITHHDFLLAIKSLRPSVTRTELQRYRQIQQEMRGHQ